MKNRIRSPLVAILRSQLEEITKYKWIESEKAGYDIGWERATRDWMRAHYPAWRNYNWEQAIAEALRDEVPTATASTGLN